MEKYLYQDLYIVEEKHWWHISKRSICKQLITRFAKQKDLALLDIGCGTGKTMEELGKFGTSFGVDISEEAIKYCKKRGLKNIHLASSDKTGFKNNSFDVVTLLDVLEHVEEKPTIDEIKRVLKTDGILLITVPAFEWLWSKWDEVLHHKRRYTNNQLAKVLEENGFKILKISYLYSFLVLPLMFVRWLKTFFYKERYPSDFQLSSPIINALLLMVSSVERWLIQFISVPIGTSLICVACKNEKN